MEQHHKYGSDFVRITHNHISINNPAAAAEIYGQRSGLLKSEFYDAFHQVRPVVFNTRDAHEHQRKRKYMNPALSARALSKFEPYMDEDLCKWKQKFLR
jgi:benzoate 4-monooxygenase